MFESGIMVVLSPHLDDAVFSCWTALTAPAEVTVVTVFAGTPPTREPAPWDRITGARDARARMDERRAEDTAALARAGWTPVHLPFVEAQYRERHPDPSELLDGVARHADAPAVVLAPAGIGKHPDHVLVRDLALVLAPLGFEVVLYAELPYSTRFGWPPWATGADPDPHVDVDEFWAQELAGTGAGERPVLRSLSTAEQRAKLEAMRDYRTQFPAIDAWPHQRLSHPELLRFEAFWPVPGGSPSSRA